MCLWRMRHFMLHWIQGMVFLWVGRRSQSSIDFFGVYSFIVKGLIDEFFTSNPWGLLFLSPALMVYHNVFVLAPAVKESQNPKNTHSHTLKITKQTYSDKTVCASHLPKEDVERVCACVVLCNTFQPKQKPLYHCSERSALIPQDQNVN